jgi:hypothetical protein
MDQIFFYSKQYKLVISFFPTFKKMNFEQYKVIAFWFLCGICVTLIWMICLSLFLVDWSLLASKPFLFVFAFCDFVLVDIMAWRVYKKENMQQIYQDGWLGGVCGILLSISFVYLIWFLPSATPWLWRVPLFVYLLTFHSLSNVLGVLGICIHCCIQFQQRRLLYQEVISP